MANFTFNSLGRTFFLFVHILKVETYGVRNMCCFGGFSGGYGYGGGSGYSSGGGFGSSFALIVVLFILLVIVGCSCFSGGNY